MHLIDSHCHLDDERYGEELNRVILNAKQVGIQEFIVPATTMQRWTKLIKLQQTYQNIHLAFGLHPCFMTEHKGYKIDALEKIIDENSAVAVGECGLDFYNNDTDEQAQNKLFLDQIAVAKNHKLPLIVHSRKSLDKVISILRKAKLKGGVVHSFSGSLQQAQQLMELNFKLGIAATICFDRAKKLQSVVKAIPLQAIVLESDAPDQAGPHYRGQLNEPAYMTEQVKVIASLKQTSQERVAVATVEATKNVFSI